MKKIKVTILSVILMAATFCKKKEAKTDPEPTPVNTTITSDIVVPTFIRASSSMTGYDLDLVITCEGYKLDERQLTTQSQTNPPTNSCMFPGYSLDLKFKSGKKNVLEIRKSYVQQLRGKATFDYDFTGTSHVITVVSSGDAEISGGTCAQDTIWTYY